MYYVCDKYVMKECDDHDCAAACPHQHRYPELAEREGTCRMNRKYKCVEFVIYGIDMNEFKL